MDSATLREQIHIYSIPVEQTQYGTIKNGTPELKYTTRANVIFNSQNRMVSEGEVFFDTSRTFIVRAYVPVDERDQIYWDNKYWRIISIHKNKYYNNKEIIASMINK